VNARIIYYICTYITTLIIFDNIAFCVPALSLGPTDSVKEGRGGLLGAIRKGKVLKKVEPPPPPTSKKLNHYC